MTQELIRLAEDLDEAIAIDILIEEAILKSPINENELRALEMRTLDLKRRLFI